MIIRFVTFISVLVMLSSCSVERALNGSRASNLTMVTNGVPLEEVHKYLGMPIKTTILQDGKRLYIYRYKKGNNPTYIGAAINSVLFVGTAGFWELLQPQDKDFGHLYITYDENDKIDTINRYISSRDI